MTTTAARSRDFMRKQGWIAECVEHRMGSFIRVDLFGVADVLAYKPGEKITLIQAYEKAKTKEHLHLDSNHEKISKWLQSGGAFVHHIWKYTRKGRKHWSVEAKEL